MKRYTDMRAVSKAIIDMKVNDTDSFASLEKKFFAIMRKYGIKRGVVATDNNGVSIGAILNKPILRDTPEWSMCRTVFIELIKTKLTFWLISTEVPKDLRCYKD
jgi:hypothetical protein